MKLIIASTAVPGKNVDHCLVCVCVCGCVWEGGGLHPSFFKRFNQAGNNTIENLLIVSLPSHSKKRNFSQFYLRLNIKILILYAQLLFLYKNLK